MNARRSFRSLVALSCLAGLVLVLAVTSPILIGWVLEQGPSLLSSRSSLLSCLFLPTLADWPTHLLSYTLAVVALLGLLLGSGSFLGQWYRTRRMVSELYRLKRNAHDPVWERLLTALKLEGKVDLIETDRPIAFCYGSIRPRICISTGVGARLNEQEIKALLLHERYHLLRRDPLKTAVSRTLASALFFLPVVRALQKEYMVAKEIEADRHVLRSQGSNRPLLGALYKLLVQQREHQCGGAGAFAVAGSTDEVNQRLDYLLNGHAPLGVRFPVLLASSAVIAAISTVMVLAVWASAASALWHQAHAGLGGC